MRLQNIWKEQKLLVQMSIALFVGVTILILFQDALYYNFLHTNYLAVHTIIEFFIIYFSFTIAIQTWLGSYYNPNNQRILFGALFLMMGIFETIHMISYDGMPFFVMETSPNLSIWFTTIQRFILPLGFIMIYFISTRYTKKLNSTLIFISSIFISIISALFIYRYEASLPVLLDATGAPTTLRTIIHISLILMGILAIATVIWKRREIEFNYPLIIAAFTYIMFCELSFLQFSLNVDFYIFLAHIFHLTGFILLFFAIYFSQVRTPYLDLKKAHESLELSQMELKIIAYYDQETGLENVHSLMELLHNKVRNKKVALFVISFSRFNTLRATFGNDHTLSLFLMVKNRIETTLKNQCKLYQFDNDQLAIYIEDYKSESEIEEMNAVLKTTLEEPFYLQHFTISLKPHIGVALYPNHSNTVEELIHHAYFAMIEAEKLNEPVSYYDNQMQMEQEDRILLEQDLSNALEGQLCLHYQPKFDLKSGEIRSVEALLRWNHPERGMVSPLEFIPIAEESGLIIPIGLWVLKTACEETMEMQHQLGVPISVAVNLSVAQLLQADFTQRVKEIIDETGINPEQVELEVTESMTISLGQIIPVLKQLKNEGIMITVDDFGTGYSSLSYLKDFPIDVLKIDRSFINNLLNNEKDEAIVNMVIMMARHLNLKVVAEGVETKDQLHYLTYNNCDFIQGFLISRPIPKQELTQQFNKIEARAKDYMELNKVE